MYCKKELSDERAIDVCNKCGISVWGEKMFNAILNNMNDEKKRGNLEYQDPSQINKEETYF